MSLERTTKIKMTIEIDSVAHSDPAMKGKVCTSFEEITDGTANSVGCIVAHCLNAINSHLILPTLDNFIDGVKEEISCNWEEPVS